MKVQPNFIFKSPHLRAFFMCGIKYSIFDCIASGYKPVLKINTIVWQKRLREPSVVTVI